MGIRAGQGADVYIVTADGGGTVMTAEPCSVFSGTIYQITNAAKRLVDPNVAITVYDTASPIAASDYEIAYANGKIMLDSAPGGAVTITGEYLSASQLAQAHEWTLSFGPNLRPSHTFGDTWAEYSPTVRRGTVTLQRFFNDSYWFAEVEDAVSQGTFVLVLYVNQSAGPRYMMIGKLSDSNPSFSVGELGAESVSFDVSGWVDWAAS